jgi:hypothetical protein
MPDGPLPTERKPARSRLEAEPRLNLALPLRDNADVQGRVGLLEIADARVSYSLGAIEVPDHLAPHVGPASRGAAPPWLPISRPQSPRMVPQ